MPRDFQSFAQCARPVQNPQYPSNFCRRHTNDPKIPRLDFRGFEPAAVVQTSAFRKPEQTSSVLENKYFSQYISKTP